MGGVRGATGTAVTDTVISSSQSLSGFIRADAGMDGMMDERSTVLLDLGTNQAIEIARNFPQAVHRQTWSLTETVSLVLDQDVTVGVVFKNTGDIIKKSGKICTDLREIDMPFKWAF